MKKLESVNYIEFTGNMDRAANKELCRKDKRFSTVLNDFRKLEGEKGGYTYQFTFVASRNGSAKVLVGFFVPAKIRKTKLSQKKFDELKTKLIANYFNSLLEVNLAS